MKTSLLACVTLLLVSTSNSWGQSVGDPPSPVVRPHAKSQQERKDYFIANSAQGGSAREAAADNFALQYPDSELRIYLYRQVLRQYQAENQRQGVVNSAKKILAIDPNDSVALVLTATALADGLETTEPNKEASRRKVEEIRNTATRAIQTVNKNFSGPPDITADQLTRYRSTLQAMAYSALGVMSLKTGDDAGAERDFQTAAALNKVQPDPYIWYHLALAQDHRRKYSAALESVEQALQLSSSNADLQKLAEIEHDRLSGLAGRGRRDPQTTGAEPPQ